MTIEAQGDNKGLPQLPSSERAMQLANLAPLATEWWLQEVTTLYPEVLDQVELQHDLVSLEQIGKEISRGTNRMIIGGNLLVAGLVLGFGGLATMFTVPEPSIKTAAFVVMIGGYAVFMVGAMVDLGGIHNQTVSRYVESWNHRGQTWLHQQRDRIFSDRLFQG